MAGSSATPRYSAPAITFHWLIAVLVIVQVPLGLVMIDLPNGPDKIEAYTLHKSIGATVLTLAALRLLWRLFNAPPALPIDMPVWQKGVAHATHGLLYVALFVVPLSGWIMSSAKGRPVEVWGVLTLPDLVAKDKALGDLAANVHMLAAYTLTALVLIHIGAALFHFFVQRDAILARMLPIAQWKRS